MLERIFARIQEGFAALPDHRRGGNRTTYRITNAVLSAFSVFVMQSASFMAHQREMQRYKGRDNMQTLFGVCVTGVNCAQLHTRLLPIHRAVGRCGKTGV